MKKSYQFTAILEYIENDVIYIRFPDLPGCNGCANDTEQAFENAKDVLKTFLQKMKDNRFRIPKPTPFSKIDHGGNEVPIIIEASVK